jgi:hypothetical protein
MATESSGAALDNRLHHALLGRREVVGLLIRRAVEAQDIGHFPPQVLAR